MINSLDFEKLWGTIVSGGPIMIPLGVLAIMLYRNVLGLYFFISRVRIQDEYRKWTDADSRESVLAFREKLKGLMSSRLKYANVLIVAAPLLGLLGTVTGMLNTFKGIGEQAGQDTTTAVADGVKVALITTQTGLMIAIIGIFFTQTIIRLHHKKDLQLVDLELQVMKRRLQP